VLQILAAAAEVSVVQIPAAAAEVSVSRMPGGARSSAAPTAACTAA
jgi:hypothetical protein